MTTPSEPFVLGAIANLEKLLVQRMDYMDERFDALNTTVADMNYRIRGNGSPGLSQRVDRLEVAFESGTAVKVAATKGFWLAVAATVTASGTVGGAIATILLR